MSFKTQAEIYQALLDGKKITNKFLGDKFIYLRDGHLVTPDSYVNYSFIDESFFVPRDWEIYKEPKKIKRTFYTMITHNTLHNGTKLIILLVGRRNEKK